MDTGDIYRACIGRELTVDHSPPSSAAVKNEWTRTTIIPLCLHGEDSDTPAFYFC